MKAIYYNIFGLGHINPTLSLVEALREKGVKVFYHSSPERRKLIESSGAKFKNYGYDEYKASDFNPDKNFVLQTIPAAIGLLPFLREEFERIQPDFILYDSMAIWGHVIGEIYYVPTFCSVATLALPLSSKRETLEKNNVELDTINLEAMKFLKKTYNIDLSIHQTLGAYGKNNIVFTAKEFNPQVPETNPGQFFFSGAMMNKRQGPSDFPFSLLTKEKNKKIITMAVGTIILAEDSSVLSWYRILIEAFFNDENFQLVLAVGSDKNKEALGDLPSNALIVSYIPQIEILKQTDCFINHAGLNSINEALYHGIPMLLIPYSNDQFVNAQRVVDLKLGLQLSKENISKENLREKIYELLSNQELKVNLENMKDNFQNHAGLDGIMNYISTRIDQ